MPGEPQYCSAQTPQESCKQLIYKPKFEHRSQFIELRGLAYHVREWGERDAPPLLMLHGWMDVGASFQFVADHLADRFRVIAPDWRGYGLTEAPGTDTYWFPDYVADLDFLMDALVGPRVVPILGHSMGGNVVMLYGGARPERCSHIINLEGFGLSRSDPARAPARMAQWLDELRDDMAMRTYASQAEVAARLMKNNPRLAADRAEFLAGHWAWEAEPGQWRIRGDAAHKRTGPYLYRLDEVLAAWRAITAPVLFVEGAQTDARRFLGGLPDFEERLTHIRQLSYRKLDQAGHMLHHDQPEQLAALIAEFLR